MIGKLKGTVEEVMQDHIILDVCGIGYLVYTTQQIISNLVLGTNAEFYTEQHITENSVKLYGLQSKEDIKVLKVLIKAKGVNYKTAITLIDKLGADGVITSIQQQNLQNLKAKGIGPKLTQRIVTELRPEFLKMQTQSIVQRQKNDDYTESVSALCNLGFDKQDCQNVVDSIIEQNKNLSAKDIIVLALKKL